jgi:hypothetical protein
MTVQQTKALQVCQREEREKGGSMRSIRKVGHRPRQKKQIAPPTREVIPLAATLFSRSFAGKAKENIKQNPNHSSETVLLATSTTTLSTSSLSWVP